jgi:hypothetical protein
LNPAKALSGPHRLIVCIQITRRLAPPDFHLDPAVHSILSLLALESRISCVSAMTLWRTIGSPRFGVNTQADATGAGYPELVERSPWNY